MSCKPAMISVLLILILISHLGFIMIVIADPQKLPIDHIIILYEENRSFDNYFGTYPGAKGFNPNVALPVSPGSRVTVSPFHLASLTTHDLSHAHTAAIVAMDGGKMDGFVYAEKSNLTMGYYDYRDIPYYWDYASKFVLCDNFFTSELEPSLPNHLFLIAGQSGGLYENADTFSLDILVIMDELESHGVSWKYYYNGASGYNKEGLWNPLPGIKSFKDNPSRLANMAPNGRFLQDLQNGSLASVVWVMPLSDESEHPPANVDVGEHYIVNLVNAVMQSKYWSSSAIFMTWDDYGGWYDHVAPPQLDSFGLGFRTPCLVISPYAKEGFIDHQQNDFCSILKFIETRYDLSSLTLRDANANNMIEVFDFNQQPRALLILPGQYVPDHYPLTLVNPPMNYMLIIGGATAALAALAIIAVILLRRRSASRNPDGPHEERHI